MATAETPVRIQELFAQAMQHYEAAVQSAARLQEESSKWFAEIMKNPQETSDLSKRAEELFSQAADEARRNIEDCSRLMSQNASASLDLMQKAVEAGQSGSYPEMMNRTHEMLEGWMAAARSNTEAIMQANTRVVRFWEDVARAAEERK